MSNDYKSINPFADEEVEEVIEELKIDREFHNALSQINFPIIHRFLPFITRDFIKKRFQLIFGEVKTIKEFQSKLAPLVKGMINKTTSGFTLSGEENLTDTPTLFIGNHRDISLDSLFLNFSLFQRNMNTVRIAIGNNLLDNSYAEKIMRLNKSFVVHRNIKGAKETYRKLLRLSGYINESLINEKESIWIAQKEGRANDGNDFTDEAVLKMLYLSNRKNKSLSEWVFSVNLTPVVISYEYDPLDIKKVIGLESREELSYYENNRRVISELVKGIIDHKGRVHLHICKSLKNFQGGVQELTKAIDKEIIENYKIWPVSHCAAFELAQLNSKYQIFDQSLVDREVIQILKRRFSKVSSKIRNKILEIYAAPLLNKTRS